MPVEARELEVAFESISDESPDPIAAITVTALIGGSFDVPSIAADSRVLPSPEDADTTITLEYLPGSEGFGLSSTVHSLEPPAEVLSQYYLRSSLIWSHPEAYSPGFVNRYMGPVVFEGPVRITLEVEGFETRPIELHIDEGNLYTPVFLLVPNSTETPSLEFLDVEAAIADSGLVEKLIGSCSVGMLLNTDRNGDSVVDAGDFWRP